MNKFLPIIIVIILLSVSLGSYLDNNYPIAKANASYNFPSTEFDLLNRILTEEIKQTALLEHIDCVSTFGGSTMYFTFDANRITKCGYPLNYTGGK